MAPAESAETFKARRKSVMPETGSKLRSASRRFSVLERKMQTQSLVVEAHMKDRVPETGNQDTNAIVELTPKGVPMEMMRYLVRWFLEEQRLEHAKGAEKLLKEVSEAPSITENHARALLAGTLLHVEVDNERKWPVFSLYKNKVARNKLLEFVEEAMKDPASVKLKVAEQKDLEFQLLMANRYDIGEHEEGEEEEDEEGGSEGGGEEEDDDDDDPMTPEEEQEENRELAEKYNTTSQEVQEFREMFQLVDLDHGGSIDGEELGKLLDLLGMAKSDEEIAEMVNKIDTTDSDEIFFPDFVRAMKSDKPSPEYTEQMIYSAFDFFSKDFCNTDSFFHRTNGLKNGFILKKQLIYALTSCVGKMSIDEAENLLHEAGLGTPQTDFAVYTKVMFQLAYS